MNNQYPDKSLPNALKRMHKKLTVHFLRTIPMRPSLKGFIHQLRKPGDCWLIKTFKLIQ